MITRRNLLIGSTALVTAAVLPGCDNNRPVQAVDWGSSDSISVGWIHRRQRLRRSLKRVTVRKV